MKMSPENKKSKKKYPFIKDYKRTFRKATFTLAVVLSPFAVTSCMGAYRPPVHQENQVQELKVNENKQETKIEPIQKKGEIKKPMILKGDIADPVHIDDTKKDTRADMESAHTESQKKEKKDEKKLKKEPKIDHIKTMGVNIRPRKNVILPEDK